MGDVVGFPDKGGGPYIQGPARCTHCQHEWAAVSPPGLVKELECPVCHTYKGIRLTVIEPEGERWSCICGNQLFFLPRTGAPVCCNCGLRATGWVDG